MSNPSTNDDIIDRKLAEEAGAITGDTHWDRVMTCRFFKHLPLHKGKYKKEKIGMCPYCAMLVEYYTTDNMTPLSTPKAAPSAVYVWEYMMTKEYDDATHPHG